VVAIKHTDGPVYKRVVSKKRVMEIVRLFVSVQYVRRAMDIREGGDDPVGQTRMIVRPI
jgi:hypothetical protein